MKFLIFYENKSMFFKEYRSETTYASSDDKLFDALREIHKKAENLNIQTTDEIKKLLATNMDKLNSNKSH